MRVTLKPERITRLLNLIHRTLDARKFNLHQLAVLVGSMVASYPAVEYGKLFYRRCDNLKARSLKLQCGDFSAKCNLTSECRSECAQKDLALCSIPTGSAEL